jgi:hypothetical protein
MSIPNKTQSFCRECSQVTWHDIRASVTRQEIEVDEDPPFPPVWADAVYDLLQCCGCECVAMRSTLTCEQLYRDDKVVRHFPPSTARRRPAWEGHLPPPAQFLIREIYDALYSGGLRLAVMGARTLVDMAILDQVGDVGTFDQKLKALEDQGIVSKRNREVLDAALDAGNASAHRGHKFEASEVNQLMDIVENLLQAIYVLEKVAQKIKTVTPPRKLGAKSIAAAVPVTASSAKPQPKAKPQPSALEVLEARVLEHLGKPPTKRPGTKQKLLSYLVAHLGHKVTEAEISDLIRMHGQAGHLVIDDKGKVTYHLGHA